MPKKKAIKEKEQGRKFTTNNNAIPEDFSVNSLKQAKVRSDRNLRSSAEGSNISQGRSDLQRDELLNYSN